MNCAALIRLANVTPNSVRGGLPPLEAKEEVRCKRIEVAAAIRRGQIRLGKATLKMMQLMARNPDQWFQIQELADHAGTTFSGAANRLYTQARRKRLLRDHLDPVGNMAPSPIYKINPEFIVPILNATAKRTKADD